MAEAGLRPLPCHGTAKRNFGQGPGFGTGSFEEFGMIGMEDVGIEGDGRLAGGLGDFARTGGRDKSESKEKS